MSSSKRSSSTAAAIIEGNEDLLIEILLFLPAKSLIGFKTVSKRWRSLISDPLFCRRHTLHHPLRRRETQTLLLTGSITSKYFICDPTIPKLYPSQLQFGFPMGRVMQSCNGLLLLRRYEGGSCRYDVFNPTTMQKREVSPLPTKLYADGGLFLMFDPYLSPHYRVVFFANSKSSTKKGTCDVYLYKSEAHEWKLVGEAIKMGVSCVSGFYFNGGICFPGFGSSCLFTPDCNITKIPDLPLHQSLLRHERRWVEASNGVLFCLTLSWNKEESNFMIVWEMKEKERRWRKKYEVNMNPIMAKCDWSAIRFVGMVRADEKEEEEDYVLMFRLHGEMKIYRFGHGVFEDFKIFIVDSHHFMETLAPV